jgi:hypothetical protein
MFNTSLNRLTLFAALLIMGLCSFSLQAHEFRYLGNGYWIGVGSHEEPPAAGEANGVDFIPTHETEIGNPETQEPLDRTAGDKVKIYAIPIKLAKEAYNAHIVQVFPVLYGFNQNINDEGELVYTADFTYPSAGTYGYYVFGEIKKNGYPKKSFAFTKFVCGKGSRDTEFGQSFDCVP